MCVGVKAFALHIVYRGSIFGNPYVPDAIWTPKPGKSEHSEQSQEEALNTAGDSSKP